MIVILDNRDSFVLNVQHRLWEIGVDSVVVPSHATRLDEIADRDPAGIIVSPGPQGPDEAGISTAAIRVFGARMPVLGICLGHQCIAVAHGVPVAPNANACHGRASPIEHDGRGVLAGLPSPFEAGRYHALAAAEPASGRAARGVGPARRRLGPDHGPAAPHAPDRGRAVPSGERADAARVRDPRELRASDGPAAAPAAQAGLSRAR